LTARERRCDVDNAVNVLENVGEIPINEIIDDNDLHAIPVLGVRSFRRVKFSCPDGAEEKWVGNHW